MDGAHERQIADLGSLRPLDTFFDRGVTRRRIAWARLEAGRPELWTATIK